MKTTKDKKFKKLISKSKIINYVSFIVILFAICFLFFKISSCSKEIPKTINKNLNYNFCNNLELHMVDVGQGDAFIIKLPNNQLMLIDSGNNSSCDKLVSYLKNNFSTSTIDYVIATHPDSDHIGGMNEIFENFKIGYVFRPFVKFTGTNTHSSSVFSSKFNQGAYINDYECTNDYYNFLQAILAEKCGWEFFNYNSDITINLKDGNGEFCCKVDFLTPISKIEDISYSNVNEFSPIILLSFNDKNILFTGDASNEAIEEFNVCYQNLIKTTNIDVLKVSHHGAESSYSLGLISSLKPNYALISCGLNNSYGHPSNQIINGLFENKSFVYRTDLNGSVKLTINKEGSLTFNKEK